jgi:hypothetical protein
MIYAIRLAAFGLIMSTCLVHGTAPALPSSARDSVALPDDRIWTAEEVDQQPETLNYEVITEGMGYPQTAYDAGIQGDVVLRILVDERGRYVRHEVVASDHPLLGIPCEIFSQLLIFKPALKDGEAVKCYAEVSYHFEIPDYGP